MIIHICPDDHFDFTMYILDQLTIIIEIQTTFQDL